GDFAGQNDEKVVGALTLADQLLSRFDCSPGAARLEPGDLIVRQSRVRAVYVGGFGQRNRCALVGGGDLRHSSRGHSTSASSRRAPRTARSGGPPCARAPGHAAWAKNRR